MHRSSSISTLTVLAMLSLTALAGCGGTGTDPYVDAPAVDFECSFVDATGCDSSNTGKKVFIGLTDNLTTTCANEFANNSIADMIAIFDFSAQTQTANVGGVLTGVGHLWVNSYSMPFMVLPAKTFKVCAFIDVDGNGGIDANEPYQESTLTVGSDFMPLSNWTNY
jgi:hypothetical protein